MLILEHELGTGKDAYCMGDAQDLTFLAENSFDLAVSYLNQCDLPDFEANSQEVYRVLRPGGDLRSATCTQCVLQQEAGR